MTGDLSASEGLRVLEFFDSIEQYLPVTEWSVDGIPAWPVLRNLLAFRLYTSEFNSDNQIAKYTGAGRVRQVLRSVARSVAIKLGDSARNASIPMGGVDVLFLSISSTRFFKVDGEWYNPYVDSFAKHLQDHGLTALDLETTQDGEYRYPRFGPSILIQNKLFRVAASARAFRRLGEEKLPGFDEFAARYRDCFNADPCYLRGYLRARMRQTLGFREYFRSVLERARPGAVLVTGYGSTETMALIAACWERRIPSYDIQHGVQGEHHFSYRTWKLPKEGYTLLPSHFWCWDDNAAASINRWASASGGRHVAFKGGNPCLEIFTKDGASLSERLAEKHPSSPPRRNILYTLQAAYALPPFVLDTIRRSPPEWTWWLRVHPQYWETREPIRRSLEGQGIRNFIIDDASDNPLASVLSLMDVHATEFSSSVLEAAEIGVPSVVLSERGKGLFGPQVASGIARVALTAEGFLSALDAQFRYRDEHAGTASGHARLFEKTCRDLAERVRADRRMV